MKHRRNYIALALLILVTLLSIPAHPVAAQGTLGAAQGTADLSVAVTANRHKVKLGQSVKFTLTVRNRGPDSAVDVVLSTNMSDHFNIVNVACSQGTTTGEGCAISSLRRGAKMTAVVKATVCCSISEETQRGFFTATVASSTPDPKPKNNTDEVIIKVRGKHSP
jgi:uncharacterized repeat protein (TIGR01451 family)